MTNGLAPSKPEGHTLNTETGESHPTTDAERAAALVNDTGRWMEMWLDRGWMTRRSVHARVDEWLNQNGWPVEEKA